jgi:hypothetical protein
VEEQLRAFEELYSRRGFLTLKETFWKPFTSVFPFNAINWGPLHEDLRTYQLG